MKIDQLEHLTQTDKLNNLWAVIEYNLKEAKKNLQRSTSTIKKETSSERKHRKHRRRK